MIPCASPVAQYRAHKDAIQAAVLRVLDGPSYILGTEVAAFESTFAAYCRSDRTLQAVGVGSGTDALIMAMRGLGIGSGDEVVTVSHTAIATVAAIMAVGGVPVLVDIDSSTYTLDPGCLEAAITSRTKAVIAVHLYGQAADLDAISQIAHQHGLAVIEDCAQASGGTYKGRRIGSLGDVACFSFYPTKNLGAIGDGGIVVTADETLAERIRRLRQYGWDASRHAREFGLNSRLDELQAAILNVKLPFLDSDNERRRALAARYDAGLSGLPLEVPCSRPHSRHVYHLYVVACEGRDELQAHLAREGIMAGIHYPSPVHREEGYMQHVILPACGLPLTDRLVGRILSLPLYPELEDSDLDRVIAAIRTHFNQSSSKMRQKGHF